ncbi:hypothetical protein GO755_22695 [Spirosoma sp. HMF4905]|uniref:Uncharacterized protein n=1 Tax=Spirosoma arboris TaxID=2682092 RepID=A0A7K1SGZ5_9BACT|nr:hypothetical protein [Spirosoma arboris]MVM32866.1 hypothetical protein [Spirosoma arboris]
MKKIYEGLTKRFRNAYFHRIPYKMRNAVKAKFCEEFSISEDTFGHKLSGGNSTTMTETECEWMEAVNPMEPAKAAAQS